MSDMRRALEQRAGIDDTCIRTTDDTVFLMHSVIC